MSDLYRTVKRLPKTELAEEGFRNDKLGEGFFKRLASDRSIVFHVTGMWSHVDLSVGIRFDAINAALYQAAVRAEWSKERAQLFKLELVAMFWEKMGDFCAAREDLTVYCPPNSTIASAEDIRDLVLAETVRLSQLEKLTDTVEYICERSLLEPFGSYMIPAAAKSCGNSKLWNWSINHFSNAMPEDERPTYLALIAALEDI